MSILALYLRVLSLLRPAWRAALTLVIANLVLATTQFVAPLLMGKVIDGLRAATKNRPVSEDQLDILARQVEDELREAPSEPTSEEVGLAVLERLRSVDEVAYLRFASVYKGFEGVDDFRREVGLLTKTTAPKQPEG